MVEASTDDAYAVLFRFWQGADLNVLDHNGWSALHCASQSGSVPTILMLLNKGLDIEQKTEDGMTPLLVAAGRGGADAVDFLISQGKGLALVYCDDCSNSPTLAFDKILYLGIFLLLEVKS